MTTHLSLHGSPMLRDALAPRRIRTALLLALGLCASASSALAVGTYWVDNTDPNASPTGPGDPARPYSSILAALAAHRDSGNTIVVRPGIYRERVSLESATKLGKPVVIRAAGPGVIIDGADDFSQPGLWTPVGNGVWRAAGVDWAPVQVFADGVRLAPSSQPPTSVAPETFLFVPGDGLYVNVGGDNPAFHSAAVGRRSHGFLVSGDSGVVIDGFQIMRTESKGIDVLNSHHVIVRNNIISQSAAGGISAETSDHVQVYGNTVSDSNHHGILFRVGVTQSIIDHNESFANRHDGVTWATGIYLAGSPDNLVEDNRVHGNQDSGIEIQTGSDNCLVRQNLSWSNGDHGYSLLFAAGTKLVGNVAWGNAHEGVSVQGDAIDTRMANCISVDRGLNPGHFALYVDSSSTPGFAADYNIVWSAAGGTAIRFGGNSYATQAAFLAATGIGPATFQGDPLFVDPANGDFHLRPGSIAIDAASTTVAGWSPVDAEGRDRADDPGTPNSGNGAVDFADRGAFEFQTGVLAVGGRTSGAGLAIASAYPNPCRRGVAFTLELANPSNVSWSVFDVMGRQVFSAANTLPGGRSDLHWSLTDRSGARVPDGMYLVRVNRGGEVATMRFVVMN